MAHHRLYLTHHACATIPLSSNATLGALTLIGELPGVEGLVLCDNRFERLSILGKKAKGGPPPSGTPLELLRSDK